MVQGGQPGAGEGSKEVGVGQGRMGRGAGAGLLLARRWCYQEAVFHLQPLETHPWLCHWQMQGRRF